MSELLLQEEQFCNSLSPETIEQNMSDGIPEEEFLPRTDLTYQFGLGSGWKPLRRNSSAIFFRIL